MKNALNINLSLLKFWLVALFLALFIARILWLYLEHLFPYNVAAILSLKTPVTYYDAQRALVGVMLFSVLSIFLSFYQDRSGKSTPIRPYRLITFLASVAKIDLSIYIFLFWVGVASAIRYMQASNWAFDINPLQRVFPFLMAGLVTSCIIISEPWRSLLMRQLTVKRLLCQDQRGWVTPIIFGIIRVIVYLGIHLLFFGLIVSQELWKFSG